MSAAGGQTLSQLQAKYDTLRDVIAQMETAMVAFSGGIDSTLLLKVAHDELGSNVVAVTANSCFLAQGELDEAKEFCAGEGIEHVVLELDPLNVEGLASNPPDRCYICKKHIFQAFVDEAKKRNISHLLDGSNVDDLGDYRPGRKALKQLQIESPLINCGFNKNDIRMLAFSMRIEYWDKPAHACLASRFEVGHQLTYEGLQMVDRAEKLLTQAGLEQVRARVHGGKLVRIEVADDEMDDLYNLATTTNLVEEIRALGFRYVAMDLEGYRMGSMNLAEK